MMIPIHSNLWIVTSSCRARPLLLTAICPCLGLAMANGMDACNMVCTDYSCLLAIFFSHEVYLYPAITPLYSAVGVCVDNDILSEKT